MRLKLGTYWISFIRPFGHKFSLVPRIGFTSFGKLDGFGVLWLKWYAAVNWQAPEVFGKAGAIR
jgi:hypothetical protein